jgi:hypothetical protein
MNSIPPTAKVPRTSENNVESVREPVILLCAKKVSTGLLWKIESFLFSPEQKLLDRLPPVP